MNRPLEQNHRQRRSNQERSRLAGWTLLETMVAHGLLVLIMTLTALLIAALSRAERNAVRSCVTQQSLSRLDELFRRDVHRAASATVANQADQSAELLLTVSVDEHVRYVIASGNLERTATAAGKEHHETYRLPNARWVFQVTDGEVQKVILALQQPADTSTQTSPEFVPLRELRFESILSLNRIAAPSTGASP
jgi:type II secretory pathway component PulJ